jgi:hydroxymethylbilane synthase
MTTRGDQILDRTLSKVGGKGLFVKELEAALADGRADFAVHSLKDVPMTLPDGFTLTAVMQREDPRDALVSPHYDSLDALPAGAVVGTSSLRRECQLRRAFPKLEFRGLRGNVNTRLAKLDAGDYDAIILAAAGLKRLGLEGRIRAVLPESLALPAICQGILGIEYRRERTDVARLLRACEDAPTAFAARAERAFGRIVEGSCDVPLGALASVSGETLTLEGFIGTPDGTRLVRERASGPAGNAESLGTELGERLLASGGREILKALTRLTA